MNNSAKFMLLFTTIMAVWIIHGIITDKQPGKSDTNSSICSINDGVSICPANKENLYKLPKGKPIWILIRSDKLYNGESMDALFYKLKSKNAHEIRFIRLNWESNKAANLIGAYTLVAPPSSLFFDSNGKFVRAINGKIKINEIQDVLQTMNMKRIK